MKTAAKISGWVMTIIGAAGMILAMGWAFEGLINDAKGTEYEEFAPSPAQTKIGHIHLKRQPMEEYDYLLATVLHEARGEPFLGMILVAGVVLDRAEDRRWGRSVQAVVEQRLQFASIHKNINITIDEMYQADMAVRRAMAGERPCGNVLWFHALKVRGKPFAPYWSRTKTHQCDMAGHRFYSDTAMPGRD